jgi:poly(beta-D-mannuronate) lyase
MIRLLLLACCLSVALATMSNTIVVKNAAELKAAATNVKPGDVVLLQNGEWSDISLIFTCAGTKEKPIVFKAQTAGKVIITGQSKLKLGGSYIVVDGLLFARGYAGKDPVIDFRSDKDHVANNCRVTNCAVDDFNNPKRMDENYWLQLYGKNNRVDHCSFRNKKNMGVLAVVVLDDARSQENFHSIDHNYFGKRLPLASNSGEIIRIGVSQTCQFNSNTKVTDNFFEHCDGETEIISVKSASNIVSGNVFKECQGGVVLRHGDNNTVVNNIFLGNNKEGTGGVRVINKGQWVVNNFFYECRGVDFRSPLSIMNGVPNSPAFRYVAVTDAVIANNTFYNCAPASLCEGSDTERSVSPSHVYMSNNIFYNERDKLIYNNYDDISGIHFAGNKISRQVNQELANGFETASLTTQKADNIPVPIAATPAQLPDSLQKAALKRLGYKLSVSPGFGKLDLLKSVQANAYNNCGAKWFERTASATATGPVPVVKCGNATELAAQLAVKTKGLNLIELTGSEYVFTTPLNITGNVVLSCTQDIPVAFSSTSSLPFVLQIKGGTTFTLSSGRFNLAGVKAKAFITTDTSGSSDHNEFVMSNVRINGYNGVFFTAAKSSVSDKVAISNCFFTNNDGTLFDFANEKDAKGYYNVEKLSFQNNTISVHEGEILAMLRGGNDESTMGPDLLFAGNTIIDCRADDPLITLYGTQRSRFENNRFIRANEARTIVRFQDAVRAQHTMLRNRFEQSGSIETNKYVISDVGSKK